MNCEGDRDRCHYLATEEFDKLCFEFGVELDEDVRCIGAIELWRVFN